MRRDVARQPQNKHIEVALQHDTPPNEAKSVQLVPNALKRVFAYVIPVDNVNCHIAHWLIRSIACSQLHNRLAVPKNGVFLLKWPLCFHNREDAYPRDRQYRYIDLLRYNVTLLGLTSSEIVDQVQIFLVGFEAMMLAEVQAAAAQRYYSDLSTFMADFSLLSDYRCTYEQTLPFRKRNAVQQQGHTPLLFGDWQILAQTIATVTNSCGPSVSNFLFITDTYAQGHALFRSDYFFLPSFFYRALNFDVMLTKMRNLQTLYIPTGDYEQSFGHRAAKRAVWRLVRQMPQTQFLPLLERMFGQDSFCLYDKHENTDDSANRLGVSHASNATLYISKLHINPSEPESSQDFTLSYVDRQHWLRTFLVQTENEFTARLLKFVSGAETTRERHQRLSVWGGKTRKAGIVLKVADFRHAWSYSSSKFDNTLGVLLDLLHTRRIHPTAVRISLEQFNSSSPSRFYWDRMRQILPFFVAGAVDNLVLRSFRLRFDMGQNFSTFSELLKQWQGFANSHTSENDELLYKQPYKLPVITMCVNKAIEIHASHVTCDNKHVENWIESIEQTIMQYIRVFLCDAVDSYVRRDLSFCFYESLQRVQ